MSNAICKKCDGKGYVAVKLKDGRGDYRLCESCGGTGEA